METSEEGEVKKIPKHKYLFLVVTGVLVVFTIILTIMRFVLGWQLMLVPIDSFAFFVIVLSLWASFALFRGYKRKAREKGKIKGIVQFLYAGGLLFIACLIILFLRFSVLLPSYRRATEPVTKRTFVVRDELNMFGRGRIKLYEQKGLFIVPCDVEEFYGEALWDEKRIYISQDGERIVIAFYFLNPVFSVPKTE